MQLYISVFLILLTLATVIGLYFQQAKDFFNSSQRSLEANTQNQHELDANKKDSIKQEYFSDIEITLLNEFCASANQAISEIKMDDLFQISDLPFQQKKQTRGILLKELNLKILIIYSLNKGVIRMDNQSDQRIKMFGISDDLYKELKKNPLGPTINLHL